MSNDRKRKATKDQGVRITERDVALLQALCRYGCTTTTTLLRKAHRGHRSGLYAQLARLVKVGLVENLRNGPANRCRPRNVHALVVPTRLAYAFIGSGLAYRAPALGTLLHTLAVAELGMHFERQGYAVTTDREIRSQATAWRSEFERARRAEQPLPPAPSSAPWIVTKQPAGERGAAWPGRTHAPDLVLEKEGDRWAVEVELTAKNDRDLRAVLQAFDRTRKYTGVLYYTPDRAIAAKIERTARTTTSTLATRLHIQSHTPLHSISMDQESPPR